MVVNGARLGTSLSPLNLVSSLNSSNMPGPIMEYHKYVQMDELANGRVRGGGLPWVEWEFRRLTPAQRDALAAFCTDLASSSVFIYTRTNGTLDQYKAYSCIMRWDADESITDYWRNVIKLKFYDCVEEAYTPP